MLAKVKSYGLIGIDGYGIEIEIDVNPGLPGYDVVGLADTAIKESKERVKSAIKNCGYNYPINKIIVKDSDKTPLGYEGAHFYKINGKYYLFFNCINYYFSPNQTFFYC